MWIIARALERPHDDPGQPAVAGQSRTRHRAAAPGRLGRGLRGLRRRVAICGWEASSRCPRRRASARFGVAAITTNLGWPSGSIILNTRDYSRYWQTTDPSALEVDLKPGVTAGAGQARGRCGRSAAAARAGCADAERAGTSVRPERAPGPAEPRRDRDAAADRGCALGRLGAQRGHLAAACPSSRRCESRASTTANCGGRCCWRA